MPKERCISSGERQKIIDDNDWISKNSKFLIY